MSGLLCGGPVYFYACTDTYLKQETKRVYKSELEKVSKEKDGLSTQVFNQTIGLSVGIPTAVVVGASGVYVVPFIVNLLKSWLNKI